MESRSADSDLFAKKVCAKEIFGSHLFLGEKILRPAEGWAGFRTQNSLAKTGETAWALLRNAHSLVGSQPLSSILVRRGGLEPPSLTAYAPRTYVYTSSTTCAFTTARLL